MKLIFKKLLLSIILFTILLECTGCFLINSVIEEREKQRQELYDQISQIEKHTDYIIISNEQYVLNNEEIKFQKLVEEQIKKDGKKIRKISFNFYQLENNIICFNYHYKEGLRFLGLNNNNNYYAVGTISLLDFSISINYFRCKYEKILQMKVNETHYLFKLQDLSKKNKDGTYNSKYMTMDKKFTSTIYWDDPNDAINSFKNEISIYSSPKIYTEKGIEYIVYETYIKAKESEEDIYIYTPTAKEILEKNEEMKTICEILGESHINNIKEHFFTNGTDLFVGFFAESGMFGYQCRMTFPVIFKCDSTLQNFEYIGCINNDDPMFFNNLKIVKK